jgi:hypothetical protein
MTDSRIVKRYNAYYHGWCLAFGDHTADYEEDRDINWLYGEDRVGLILSSGLRKQAQRELLGRYEEVPTLTFSDDMVKMNEFIYRLNDEVARANVRRVKDFILRNQSLHMFLCSHFIYPDARIISFCKKKPVAIMYKEMQPLKLIVE